MRCCNAQHLIHLMEDGSLALLGHTDKDADDARLVAANLAKTNDANIELPCLKFRRLWKAHYGEALAMLGNAARFKDAFEDTVLKYQARRRAQLTAKVDPLTRSLGQRHADWMAEQAAKAWRSVRGQQAPVFVGRSDVLRDGCESSSTQIVVPRYWKRNVADKGLSIIDGQMILDVIGKEEVKHLGRQMLRVTYVLSDSANHYHVATGRVDFDGRHVRLINCDWIDYLREETPS